MSENTLLIVAALGAGAYFIMNRRHGDIHPGASQAVSVSQGSAMAPVASYIAATTPVLSNQSPTFDFNHIATPVLPPAPQVASPTSSNYVALAPAPMDVVVASPFPGIIYVNPEYDVAGGPASGDNFYDYMNSLMQKYADGVSYPSDKGPPADYIYMQAHVKQTGGIHG